ncbi:MAG: chromate transporter [Spirochaetaceae bacterium]|jgi:chromate transporter|nr:chromate transporter [Spirochaetaceae bacterium]
MRELAGLFFTFAKMGCVTFGGGYAMMPVLEREIINKRRWASLDEITRCYAIAQVTPGVIAVNVSTFIGYKRAGIAGGIAATLGFTLPSVTMAVIAAELLGGFSEIEAARHIFNGIRLAVGALVLDTVVKLAGNLCEKNTTPLVNIAQILMCAAAFTASFVWNTNPVLIVAAAALAGFFLRPSKRPSKKHINGDGRT